MIPYGDPNWYQGWNSVYYKETHRKFRALIREFVDREITPYCHQWDESKQLPKELFKRCASAGFTPLLVGLPWPTKYVGDRVGNGEFTPGELDPFHELIFIDEVSRCGSGGVLWGLSGGLSIGLPPVLHFGSEELKERIVPPVLRGEKFICLAITEPYAGSDVANIQTTAKLSEDGKYYIVNGEKKWITNGTFADYFTTAVRTGDEGPFGVSLLLIERTMPGVRTEKMNCMGVWSSGTAYVTFENVKVPVENLIGAENLGFKAIMHNFNHERWSIAVQAIRFARVCCEEAFKWAVKRKTFGKRLVDHPVIRAKFAEMIRQIEASQAWLELITYQLSVMPKKEQSRLAGTIAILKAHASKVFEFCAREALQIFGGSGYTRGGQGEKVERLYREVRAYAIPGGSEEIMLDLGVRQALRQSKL